MDQKEFVTKEYFNKEIHDTIQELKSDFHEFARILHDNADAHYTRKLMRQTTALEEGFADKLQVAFDQVKSVTDKTEGHEQRICILEKAVL
jgi:hypothetical protein